MIPQEYTETKGRAAAGRAIDQTFDWFIRTLEQAPASTNFPTSDDVSLSPIAERGWVLYGRAHRINFVGLYEHAINAERALVGRLYFRVLDGDSKLGREFFSILIDQHAAHIPGAREFSPAEMGETLDAADVLRHTSVHILRALQLSLPTIQ